jgi:Ran-binding protein 9/10
MEVDTGASTGGANDAALDESADLLQCARALVLQHLVQNCHKKSAIAFAESLPEKEILDETTLDDMDKRANIAKLLLNGRVMDAVELADHLIKGRVGRSKKDALRTVFPALYFRLGCQHFVELVRARHPENALEFAQQSLASYGNDAEHMDVLQDITVLLAYEEPERSPNGSWMAPEKRELLAADLNLELYSFCNSRPSSLSSSLSQARADIGGLELALRQLAVCGKLSTPSFTLEQALK